MSIEDFNDTRFTHNQSVMYKGDVYKLKAVDFEEALLGIDEKIPGTGKRYISWKRCENIEIIDF
jgi:hypothetical protein